MRVVQSSDSPFNKLAHTAVSNPPLSAIYNLPAISDEPAPPTPKDRDPDTNIHEPTPERKERTKKAAKDQKRK